MLLIGFAVGTSVGVCPGLGAVAANAAPVTPTKPPSAATLSQQITNAENQFEIVVEQYDSIRVAIAATRANEDTVNAELAPLRLATATAHAKVATMAANVYQSYSPAATFGSLLGADSTPELVNQLDMINQIARTQRQQVNSLGAAAATYVGQLQKLAALEYRQHSQYAVLKAKRTSISDQIAHLKSLRRIAYGPSGAQSTSTSTGVHAPPTTAGGAGKAVRFAYAQLGKSYQFGASGPNSYDCSGLTMRSWQQAGVDLPHSAAQQFGVTRHVSRTELQPGDLVFYYHPVHHVAIYIGSSKVIAAPTYGEPVKISPLTLAPIAGYGRP